jgi:hypothetical protein
VAFRSVRPKIWRVSRRAGREIWKLGPAGGGEGESSSSLSDISGLCWEAGAWKV